MYNKRMLEIDPEWQEDKQQHEENLKKSKSHDEDVVVGTTVSTPVNKRGRKAQLYAASKSSMISSSSNVKKEGKKSLLKDKYRGEIATRKRKQGDRIRRQEKEFIASQSSEKVKSKKRKTKSKLNIGNDQQERQLQKNPDKHRNQQQSASKPEIQQQQIEEEENQLDALVNTPQFKDAIIQIVKEGLRTGSALTKRMVRSKMEKLLAIDSGVLDRRKKKINQYISEALSESTH
mmetsp:Transcript_26881/g.37515  ORF Transcript_26881/g.37515 Transcript_26881/m.37515 type:complete len:233 (-) Transcript_26881:230-928(-)